jgi:seryl-tRNA synthetase
MLDIQFIRDNPDVVQQAAANKGVEVSVNELLELDRQRRDLIGRTGEIRAARNDLSARSKNSRPTEDMIQVGKELKLELASKEEQLAEFETRYRTLLKQLPNIPSEDTPIGDSEDKNQVLRQVGDKPKFDFEPKPHWEMTDYIEQERAAKISGSRFAFIQGGAARLQMALMAWGMDQLSDEQVLKTVATSAGLNVSTKPFLPMLPPVMMRTKAYEATGRLKPDDVTFRLANDDLWLIGSSEHSMCAYLMNDTVDEAELPLRFVGYSPAFRREVGSAGKDTRGILRVHQFNKLEMESFTDEASSRSEHEFMIAIQEYLMQQLELPYQVVLKCTFDMGGPNARGVDIETWMPGQNAYRETHSADWLTDYQSRGLNTKYVNAASERNLVHTNDATALADRTLIAILENYQNKDGSIRVPAALQNYLGGKELL